MKPWTLCFKTQSIGLWNICFHTFSLYKLRTCDKPWFRESNCSHVMCSHGHLQRTRLSQGQHLEFVKQWIKLPDLRHSSINILYPTWDQAPLEWFPVSSWSVQDPEPWHGDVCTVFGSAVSSKANDISFSFSVPACLLDGSDMWIEVVLCKRGQLNNRLFFWALAGLGTTGNVWTIKYLCYLC